MSTVSRHRIRVEFDPTGHDPLVDLIDSLHRMQALAMGKEGAVIDWTTLRIEDGESIDTYDYTGNEVQTYTGPMEISADAMAVKYE